MTTSGKTSLAFATAIALADEGLSMLLAGTGPLPNLVGLPALVASFTFHNDGLLTLQMIGT
jgi:hypothetical protein